MTAPAPPRLDVTTLRWVADALAEGPTDAPAEAEGEVADWLTGVIAAVAPEGAIDREDLPLADDVETVLREWHETGALPGVDLYAGIDRPLARAAVVALMRRRRIARRFVPEPADPLLDDVRRLVADYYEPIPEGVSTADAVRTLGRAYTMALRNWLNRTRDGERLSDRDLRLIAAERVCLAMGLGDHVARDIAMQGWRAITDPKPTNGRGGAT